MVYVVTFLGKSNSKSYSIILFEISRNFRNNVQRFTFKYLKEDCNFNRYVFKNIKFIMLKLRQIAANYQLDVTQIPILNIGVRTQHFKNCNRIFNKTIPLVSSSSSLPPLFL